MQVIAGKYSGRKLVSVDSQSTRPTLARVKESLFSIIDEKISGRVVLDLFAGSGALGIEAISRGAQKVYFVEHSADAKKIIEKNLKNIVEPYEIVLSDFESALKSFARRNIKFDLVLADPPYDSDFLEKSMRLLLDLNLMKKDGLIALESDCKKCLQIDGNRCIISKTRTYGIVKVTICKYIGE